jgi:uncharacterized protein YpmS
MPNKPGKRMGYIFSVVFIILALVIGFSTYAAFSGSSIKAPKTSQPSVIMDKVKNAQIKGETLELTSEDINTVIASYVNKGISKGGLTVKEAYSELGNDTLSLYALINNKNIDLLLNTTGKLVYENEKVIFEPTNFKVGKLLVPKAYVMKTLKNFSREDVTITDKRVEIDKNLFPFDIEALKVEEGKVVAEIKKITISEIFGPITNVGEAIEEAQEPQESQNSQSQQGSTDNKVTQNTSEKQNTSSKQQTSKPSSTAIEQRKTLLKKVSSQLGTALGDVKTSKEKAVISSAVSAVNKMAANPSGGIITGEVQTQYKKLTPEEKSRVKNAIFNNVDMRAASELARLFGM